MSRGCAEGGQQHLHLFFLSSGGEERRARVYLKDEAAQRPHIDLVVIRFHKYNLGGAIISTLNVGKLFLVKKAG